MFFNRFDVTYDSKTKIYTFGCDPGSRFKSVLNKMGYKLEKQKYLFHHYSKTGFSIHRFFLPDLSMICKVIRDNGSEYDVNMSIIKKIIDYIAQLNMTPDSVIKIDFDRIKSIMKFEPLRNQLPAYKRYSVVRGTPGMRGMLLDGAVGVGKTYISLSMAVGFNMPITLVIAPLQTINKVWLSSLSGDGCLYKQPQASYLIGSDEEYSAEPYIIAHYENLPKLKEFIAKSRLNIDMIIVDEVHNFNDLKSNRTKVLIEILDANNFKHAIGMSGTPVKAKATDLIPLLKLINTDFNNVITQRFLKIYNRRSLFLTLTMRTRYETGTVVLKKEDMKIPELSVVNIPVKLTNGSKYTLESIRKRLDTYLTKRVQELVALRPKASKDYFRLSEQAFKTLLDKKIVKPSDIKNYKTNVVAVVKAGANGLYSVSQIVAAINVFERTYIESELKPEDRKLFRSVKTIHKYPELKAQGEALANIVMRSRIDCYSELALSTEVLDKLISGATKKTIIFSNYIQVCESATSRCKSVGLQPTTVYGDTSKLLSANVSLFTNKPKINPLIATYKSLSTGVPITAANVCVIFGLPHRQYLFDQAIGRAWRTGQDRPVFAYIVELDTGTNYNITDRDLDIITFFRKEVTNLTGNQSAIAIDRDNGLGVELGIRNFLIPQDSYLDRATAKVKDIVDLW